MFTLYFDIHSIFVGGVRLMGSEKNGTVYTF